MICDDCGKECEKTYEVTDLELCSECIEPPESAYASGVIFDGLQVFAVVDGKVYEIMPEESEG